MNIINLLASDNFIIYNKDFARTYGVDEAIVLGAFCGYQQGFKNEWFYREQDLIIYDTALKLYSLRTAIKNLSQLGVVETKKIGMPAKYYYRINSNKLQECVDNINVEYLTSRPTENLNSRPTEFASEDNNISDISLLSDNQSRYNNLKEKELSKEDITDKDIRGCCEQPTLTSKNLFSKNNKSSTSTELKHIVSDKITEKKTPVAGARTKNAQILENLKKYVFNLAESKEVKEALYKWLDILEENKKLMSKDQLAIAMEYLDKATNQDDVKIEAIKIASMKGYRDFEYTIGKAKENLHKVVDFMHPCSGPFRKIEDIAKEQADEFRKEMEAHPEKYVVPEFF